VTKAENRQYAKDCIRIAQGMNARDQEELLNIAEAWEMRAAEVEKKEKRKGPNQNGAAGHSPSET
jgi:hypothetical protein